MQGDHYRRYDWATGLSVTSRLQICVVAAAMCLSSVLLQACRSAGLALDN